MEDMRNIVVLKDLPSNLVEEAIIVLKQNQKIKKGRGRIFIRSRTLPDLLSEFLSVPCVPSSFPMPQCRQ